MIEYIKGQIEDLSPDAVVVEANGVGYGLNITLNTYTALQSQKQAKLFAREVIREDAYTLFGFFTRAERELFDLLVSVNSIGAQTARLVLSAFTPADLVDVILNEDVSALKSVKSVGEKAAQRIVIDLRKKVQKLQGIGADNVASRRPVASQEAKEAVSALQTLGFPPAVAQKAALEVVKDNPAATVEEIIRKALKML
ncbi:MAG: Holliday junction branch migration protein RuvA [Alloprevotella sp.]|nr:Holliday junction branch migration protein RuvA [Alloprevotella sp.]